MYNDELRKKNSMYRVIDIYSDFFILYYFITTIFFILRNVGAFVGGYGIIVIYVSNGKGVISVIQKHSVLLISLYALLIHIIYRGWEN